MVQDAAGAVVAVAAVVTHQGRGRTRDPSRDQDHTQIHVTPDLDQKHKQQDKLPSLNTD